MKTIYPGDNWCRLDHFIEKNYWNKYNQFLTVYSLNLSETDFSCI